MSSFVIEGSFYQRESDERIIKMSILNFTAMAQAHGQKIVLIPEDELIKKQQDRELVIKMMIEGCMENLHTSLIISGPAGLGKSHIVYSTLKEKDPNAVTHTIVKGYMLATGLYIKLYENRHKGNVLVLDDADKILSDETSLNILKAVCDTNVVREVSWLSNAILLTGDGEKVPKTFEFEGSVIIITNYDMDAIIENKKSKMTPHLQALISRAHCVDFELKTARDYMIRVKMIVRNGNFFAIEGLSVEEIEDVLTFMEKNVRGLKEISLRTAKKIGGLRKTQPNMWKNIAAITCMKKGVKVHD